MKKINLALTIVLIFAMIFPATVSAFVFTPSVETDSNGDPIPLSLYSKAVYMINLDTGEILVDINGENELVPASLTKIMTAAIVLDNFEGNEKKLKSTYASAGSEAFDELYGTGASTADIQPNEKVSYYDLLAALMLPSSCEAANIIAIDLGGSISGFTDLMNEKANELGMKNSHFSNAHGLFVKDNYSSCKDMAILSEYLLKKYDVFKDIIEKPSYKMSSTDYHSEGTLITNTNYALSSTSKYYNPNIKGIKTGALTGRCLASYASYDGYNYLTVTMDAPLEKTSADQKKGVENPTSVYADDNVYYNIIDHNALYDWAFNSLVSTDFINPNSEVAEANVEFGSNADYVNLKPASGYNQLWPKNIPIKDVKQEIVISENIIAPIETGDVLGKLNFTYDGETIASVDLVSTSKVDRSQANAKITVAKAFIGSTEFKWAIFSIIMLFVIYSVGYIIYMQMKYMKK